MKTPRLGAILTLFVVSLVGVPAKAGSHLWKFAEAFSNADGTIQFIELVNANSDNFEQGIPGHVIQSNSRNYTIPLPNLPPTTAFKRLLFATPAYAAIPGAPTPDYIIPAGSVPFFSIGGDTLACTGWPSMTFGSGALPTDGIHSLVAGAGGTCPCTTAVNSPTNYAGTTGSIDASPAPPAIPDGSHGSTPMKASKVDAAGTSLSVTFDTASCSAGSTGRQILYGQRSQLPAAPGGSFQLTGSACSITTSPFVWNPSPSPTGGTGLVWWLMTTQDGTNREGSWGKASDGQERVGPGTGGSSGQCGVTSRVLSNACGH